MEYSSLNEAICDLFGNDRKIVDMTPVAGGDINEAKAVTLNDGTIIFMKSNRLQEFPSFQAESRGLQEICNTGAIRTPKVLGLGTDSDISFLLLEFVSGGQKIRNYWETLAEELAAMHRAQTDGQIRYGFHGDNRIGSTRQINTPHDTWISFFRDCRLLPQFQWAQAYFDAEDRKQIGYLLEHLDQYLVEAERPALIHGDLWAGNVITGNDGKAWLIDPAVYYGYPEADLAMTELFGGFSYTFYEAYREAGGLEDGYQDRRDLYNLYHLLNHLNLFGRSYLSSVKRIIKRYAG